jgi:two-component system, chemotaxis family, chemotaxis protein CheY
MDSEHRASLEPVSVLIVDDDRETSDVVAALLRGAGYTVETAVNGHEGLVLLRRVRPALILLDVHMPIMDGPHFREAQRQDPGWLAIPTIVMTADPDVNPILDLAVERTVRKPLRRTELLTLVETYCGPRRAA